MLWTGSFPLAFNHVEIYPFKKNEQWSQSTTHTLTPRFCSIFPLFHLQTLAKSFSHCPYFPLLPSRWSLPLASSLQQTSLTKVNYDLHATKSNRNFSGIRFSHFSAAFDPGDGFHHLETCSPLGCRVLMFILPPLPFFLSNVCWLIASTWLVNVAVTRAGLCSFFSPRIFRVV